MSRSGCLRCSTGSLNTVIRLRLDTAEDYDAGIESYLARRFADAISRFDLVVAANPNDKSAVMYLERSRELAEKGVDEDWTGVDRLDFK